MLVAAAVCPCPPLLVPQVAAGAAAEVEPLRAACSDALAVVTAARPDRLVVLGPAEQPGISRHPQGAAGSFREFGVDLEVRLGEAAGERPAEDGLPASLAVAAWLLEHTGWAAAPVEGLGIDTSLSAERCAEAGAETASPADRVALLVMGDGSACRSVKAPGYLDERAADFDAEAARALGGADPAGLLALDTGLAQELGAVGRAPWQVLAGAGEGAALSGELLYDEAPYGVGYLVAAWS
ncbi:class III extradiol dioxygenase subunit B-like domain-containing protein [Streptomyces sp. TP-A0874]|uniref:class III extradiol dioxygenase subunit B-like domain-containing protein n=1 Tax=Streptomyces sp. TP-A0874 TaxID=549819 RepID=UPI000852EF18|nr:class III extradiol dioxygenase subunit B-like domain-containing protein [Streptomyces sp. TP-A0874]